jgi:hypothetical protein
MIESQQQHPQEICSFSRIIIAWFETFLESSSYEMAKNGLLHFFRVSLPPFSSSSFHYLFVHKQLLCVPIFRSFVVIKAIKSNPQQNVTFS